MAIQTQQRQTLEKLEEVDALQRGDRIFATIFHNAQTSETLEVAVQTPGTDNKPMGCFQFIRPQLEGTSKKIRMYEIRRKDLGYDRVGQVLVLKGEVTTVRDYSEQAPEYLNLIQTIKIAGLDEI